MGCGQPAAASPRKIKRKTSMLDISQILLTHTKSFRQGPFNFLNEVEDVKRKILSIPEERIIVRHDLWRYVFEIFSKLYLNSGEKEQLINFYKDFLEASLEEKTHKQQHNLCEQLGQKVQCLENRVYFKHIYCLQHFAFAIHTNTPGNNSQNNFSDYNFDMSDEQVQNMSSTIRKFSQNDLDSFAFVSLYMVHAVNKCLQNGVNFEKVQRIVQTTLLSLQKLYPASTNSQVEVQQFQIKNLKNVKFEKNFEICKFQNNQKSHFQQFYSFVLEKAQKAKIDEDFFIDLVKDPCIQKGYGFKNGLKIKNVRSSSAIFRTIEKTLDQQVYEKSFSDQKEIIMNLAKTLQNGNGNKLKSFIDLQIDGVKKIMSEILERQHQMVFNVKDLLRAKCYFSKVQQIIEAVENILSKIIEKNLSLLDFKNRLSKKTKDITLVINLPNSIAELQLALHCDTTANEFNHKIYELIRSRIYTPITNLYVNNQKWCSSFFSDQFELFEEKIKNGGNDDFGQAVKFSEIMKQVQEFKQRFLLCDFLSISIQDKTKDQSLAQSLMKQLDQIVETLQKVETKTDSKFLYKKEDQILNQVNFYKGANKSELAQKLFEETSIMKDPSKMDTIIVKLKGDVLFSKDKYAQAIKCYEILVKLYEICNQVQCIEYASYLDKIAQCHLNIGNYSEALDLFQKCLALYIKINGPESHDCQRVYHDLGMTYYNKGDYEKGLQYYKKDLQLAEKLYGKQSFEISAIIHNMGLIYECQRQIPEALSCYEKALKIEQHYKGRESRQCAITLGNIAIVYYRQQNYEKSLQMQQRTLKLKQKIAGQNSMDCAITLTNIGQLYQQLKNYEKSEQTFLESLAIKSSIKGPDDIDCAFTLYNLGRLYYDWDKASQAVQYCRKAYNIRRNIMGDQHPDTINAHQWLTYSQELLNGC